MATGHYRFETKMIGRRVKGVDKSVSMVAKAAYRSGQSLHDDRADKTFNYRPRAQEVIYSEIMSPQNAPAGSRSQARTFRPGHGNNATRGNNSGTRSSRSRKHVNTALEKAGREERVDRRSLKARGIEQIPEPKIGVAATAMKRLGVEADPKRFQDVRAVKLLNEVMPTGRCDGRRHCTALALV